MSLQALMAVLGHVTPEMTLRYATLASPTLRSAYDEAIGKVRRIIPIAPAGQPAVPAKVDWIASEFLKTRVAHGYCSRHLAAGACAYSNICETCDNFIPGRELCPLCRVNSPTSASCTPTPSSEAGRAKPNVTAGSSALERHLPAARKHDQIPGSP